MKMAGRLFAAVLLSATVGCQGGDDAASTQSVGVQASHASSPQGSECITRFEGITQCALGNASLSASDEGVTVTGLDDPEHDGVASNFDGAVSWRRRTAIDTSSGSFAYALAARDADQVVSTLRVETSGAPGEVVLTPRFTGGAAENLEHVVNIYREGVLQGSSGGGADARYVIITDIFGFSYIMDDFAIRFHILELPFNKRASSADQEGACIWRTRFGDSTFTIELNGEQLEGDQIEFVEKIGQGAYPYTSFSGLDMTSGAGEVTLLDESVTQAP